MSFGIPASVSRAERTILTLVIAALVLFVAAIVVYTSVPGSVGSRSLGHSVANEVGESSLFEGDNACEPARQDEWTCEVLHEGSSGVAVYDVEVSDHGCWEGRLRSKTPLTSDGERRADGYLWPAEVDGCVRVGDNVRLTSRLFP